jgi:hypothetical protein
MKKLSLNFDENRLGNLERKPLFLNFMEILKHI